MELYKITNKVSGSVYIGITKGSAKKRFYSHKCSAKMGLKTKLYDAIRSYGAESFKLEVLNTYSDRRSLELAEINCIKSHKNSGYSLYNILSGGVSYFPIKDKEAWKLKLKEKRKGRKPALGMKHSKKNRDYFSKVSREYWESQNTYNVEEIKNLTLSEAIKNTGISKTHYYRLKNKLKKI